MSSTVAKGDLARMGLLGAAACEQAEAVIAQAAAARLETIRVLFVDQHGILRGKTIVASPRRATEGFGKRGAPSSASSTPMTGWSDMH